MRRAFIALLLLTIMIAPAFSAEQLDEERVSLREIAYRISPALSADASPVRAPFREIWDQAAVTPSTDLLFWSGTLSDIYTTWNATGKGLDVEYQHLHMLGYDRDEVAVTSLILNGAIYGTTKMLINRGKISKSGGNRFLKILGGAHLSVAVWNTDLIFDATSDDVHSPDL